MSLRNNTTTAAETAAEKGTIHTKRHSQEDPGGKGEKTELSLAGSLRSAGSMATSAGSAIIQKVIQKIFFFLSVVSAIFKASSS